MCAPAHCAQCRPPHCWADTPEPANRATPEPAPAQHYPVLCWCTGSTASTINSLLCTAAQSVNPSPALRQSRRASTKLCTLHGRGNLPWVLSADKKLAYAPSPVRLPFNFLTWVQEGWQSAQHNKQAPRHDCHHCRRSEEGLCFFTR